MKEHFCPVEKLVIAYENQCNWCGEKEPLQALHDENQRLGLYKDAYAQPEQELVADDFFKMIADKNPKPFSTPQHTFVGLTGKILISAAQSSLAPDQYGHFVAISEYEPEVYDRLAKAIQRHLKEKNT